MTSQHEQRNPIEVLAEEFVQRRRLGEHPTIEQYSVDHPQLADRIRHLFPAMVAIEQVKSLVADSGDRTIELRVDRLERLGDYRILREIGRGGMGIVYEAEQQSLGRLVAVKVFPQQILGNSRQLQRFRREARVAANLHHTNIVQVFGVGDQDGLSYYVMQLIRGVSLDRVIDRLGDELPDGSKPAAHGSRWDDADAPEQNREPFTAAAAARAVLSGDFRRWSDSQQRTSGSTPSCSAETTSADEENASCEDHRPPDDDVPPHRERVSKSSPAVFSQQHAYWRSVAQIGVQVGEALQYAHAHDTLHRDIKPANLLLDSEGTVWVTDFGVAKAVAQEQLSRPGDVVGTLRYMSPEQLQGACDARSDIYSLGLTLYELVALRPAFGQSNEEGLIQKKLERDPIPPRKLHPEIPRDLETIVLKSIARDPKRRYQAAGELVDDLTRFLDGRPIRARRVGPAERLWRWSRRNPAVASLSALLVLVVFGSFAAVSWKWRETEAEKKRVQEESRRAESNLSLALDSMGHLFDRFESTWMAHPCDPEDEQAGVSFRMAVSDENAAVLEEALVFYDQFATQNASNPRLQRDTADAHRRVGEIYERLGEYGKAEKAYGRAVEIYEFQSSQPVKDANLASLLASTLNQLGRTEKMLGRFKDAGYHFGRAKQVLVESGGDSPQSRYELARTHGNLASVMWHLGKPEEGGRSDRQAVQLLEQLASEHPKNAEYRLALARAYCRYHPAMAGDIDGRKREWFRTEAVASIEALADEFPQVPDYRCELSETLATISLEILGPGGGPNLLERHAAAESLLRRALEQAEGITEEYREIPRYRAVLARAQKDLAWLLHITNRSHRAEFRLAEAVAIYEDLWREFPDVEVYQFLLAMALESQGQILRHTGHLSESRQAIDRSIEQLRSYMEARPQAAFCQGILAHQYDSLAETLKLLGAKEEAAEAGRSANEMRRDLKDAVAPRQDGQEHEHQAPESSV